jgi:hypothetical protein
VEEYLKTMKFDIIREPLQSQFKPTPAIIEECRDAGELLAKKAIEAQA